jgi:chromosome partitioning protein
LGAGNGRTGDHDRAAQGRRRQDDFGGAACRCLGTLRRARRRARYRPQGSLAAWVDLRRARLGGKAIGFEFAALPGWRATQWIEDRAREADLVVIDNPPHAETEARMSVRAAKLVLIPVQPSPLDLWATEATLKMARDERRPSLVVLNRVAPRSGLGDEIAADFAGAGVPLSATRIGNRVALARAMASGLGVVEIAHTSPAAAEIKALAGELRSGGIY